MPNFVKLDLRETTALFEKPEPATGKRAEWARLREEYRTYLKSLGEGESGKLQLGEGEAKSTIRARLSAAAKELALTLEYKRTRENEIIFRVAKTEKPEA